MASNDDAGGEVPEPGAKSFTLAPEIIQSVIKQVKNRRDLTNIRLVSKELADHAAEELFEDVFVSPADKHVEIWNSITQDDKIRQIPWRAIIQTHSSNKKDGSGNRREDEEIDETFEDAVSALSKFPNIDSVEIRFTPNCVGVRELSYWEAQDVAEGPSRREDMLRLIFQSIEDRADSEEHRAIRNLTIVNLQNNPLPDFTSSDLFLDVMSQLEELHISIVQEYNEYGPDHDYSWVELQTFPAHLCSDWLKPISGNLKALSIYQDVDNWGPFPGYFDPSGISFPKLESLALGLYTLAHDNDLDWIVAIKPLKRLIMHNCMIASWMTFSRDPAITERVRMHDWVKVPVDPLYDDSDLFSYGGKWSQYLDRIAGGLPNLVEFRFDSASPKYGLEHRGSCGTRISPQRYICYNEGMCPAPWMDADDDGFLESLFDDGLFPHNVHKETLEEDRKSLDRLLGMIERPRS